MMIRSGHCEYVLLQTSFTPSRSFARFAPPEPASLHATRCYFAHLTSIWLECDSVPVLANRVRELRHRVPIASPCIVCVKPAHPPVGRVSLTILPFVFIVVCRSLLHRGESEYLASSSRRIDAVFVPDVCEHPVASAPLVFVLDITQYLQTVHGFGHACVYAVLVVLVCVCDDACRERRKTPRAKSGTLFSGPSENDEKGVSSTNNPVSKSRKTIFCFFLTVLHAVTSNHRDDSVFSGQIQTRSSSVSCRDAVSLTRVET